jgi:phage tail-like protein
MPLFPANINRFDPYKAYRFLVYFGSSTTPVAAVSKIGMLKRSSDVIEYKEGGYAIIRKGLGRTKYEPITLERGVTQDPTFQAWADYAQKLQSGAPQTSLKNLRQNIIITLLNEAAQAVIRYKVYRCWVSE